MLCAILQVLQLKKDTVATAAWIRICDLCIAFRIVQPQHMCKYWTGCSRLLLQNSNDTSAWHSTI